jgi:hypothetical protein
LIVREGSAADWPEVAEFFLSAPLQSETSFVLDRRPDFSALPALRGHYRTLLVFQQRRLAGTVTALWHPARDGPRTITLGELIDLRVAPWARGGRAIYHLLHASHEVFSSERVDWITCLIGRHNRAALPAVAGRIGLPRLTPLEDFASVHFVAARMPRLLAAGAPTVRAAEAADAALLAEYCEREYATQRFAPTEPISWPDPSGRHRAWLAFDRGGSPCGALLTWDGAAIRRLRILRYRAVDLPLRWVVGAAARLGLSNPLPAPGEALGLWATRLLAVRNADRRTLHQLLGAALAAATAAGQSLLQVSLRGGDPLLRSLPRYPRSTYWSTLYGWRCDGGAVTSPDASLPYYVDIARA